MSSFKGSYSYSVDAKGRINIPAKLRKYVSPDANETFVITRGYEQCLFVYPLDEWMILEQSIRHLSPSNSQHRYFTRTLLQYAIECQLDAQSRLTVPKELLQFARIEDQVLILGVLERIELWNPQTHDSYLRSQTESYEDVAQKVFQR
ncbi:MAG: division/cell wall cluster transcriptional repressor MraZ [Ignavibacteria bacterium]|nr:division/cell wall cluster transcriptional repressor MraZ [Ignavibacteria bacterium]